ncbi:MAG: hypothetical protein CMP23_15395 [Rickettsiales bacterium]|nr:hypothetical protein [Rickettsiales bacterium]|tara:strand:- start:1348 stop:1716 length:369 start_codon:yes stop_codon:yes gene_type:complete
MTDSERVFHIAAAADWQRAQGAGIYRCASLEDEGFVHCSRLDQLLIPANERFVGRRDLLLLALDPQRLSAPLRWEDCYATGQRFPHIYGAIKLAEVCWVRAFLPGADGRFALPVELYTSEQV